MEKNQDETELPLDLKNSIKQITIILIATLLACSFVISFFIWHWHNTEISGNIEDWAQFGDFFGGILNPIVGLAGISLLAYTLRQNQLALTMTAQELKASTTQLANSAQALSQQKELMEAETRERCFLTLLQQLREAQSEKHTVSFQGNSKNVAILEIARHYAKSRGLLSSVKPYEETIDTEVYVKKFQKLAPQLLNYVPALYSIYLENKNKSKNNNLELLIVGTLHTHFIAALASSIADKNIIGFKENEDDRDDRQGRRAACQMFLAALDVCGAIKTRKIINDLLEKAIPK